MMRALCVLLGGLLWAGGVFAQTQDCSKVPAGYRSRCQEAKRVQQICAGLQDPAKKACFQKNIHYGRLKSDCSLAKTPERKAKCANNNHAMDLADRCSGKVGADLKTCADSVGLRPAGTDAAATGAPPGAAAAPAPAVKSVPASAPASGAVPAAKPMPNAAARPLAPPPGAVPAGAPN